MNIPTTITRSRLIEAAEQTLAIAEERLMRPVSPGLAEEIREVARTTTRISYSWKRDDGCGCLVGTARMRRGLRADPDSESESEEFIVGGSFYTPFMDLTGATFKALTVVEDPVVIEEVQPEREPVLA